MTTGPARVVACSAFIVVLAVTSLAGYVLQSSRWPSGRVVMQMQLGASGTLIDGSSSWGSAAEGPLAEWNGYLAGLEFRVVRDSTAPIASQNGSNNVFWDNDIYGRGFGSSVAYTLWWFRGSTTIETDVIFNTEESWNSYRGPLRRTSSGDWLYDIRRVALHEYGHVLGLLHPDEHGQQVDSVMNSSSHEWEHVQPDDAAGAQALYRSGGTTPGPTGPIVINFPPRNESLEFRQQLEARYRDSLRRSAGSSFVDIEGGVVWTQEYLRYRVNRCDHLDASSRVMMQIDGRGIQPVCGTATSATFPPRNEPFDFRNQLEAKYRDGLKRSSIVTYVDVEGDIVWTQEYLRYRVNRCSHQQATDRVFQQIDGRGVQPVC